MYVKKSHIVKSEMFFFLLFYFKAGLIAVKVSKHLIRQEITHIQELCLKTSREHFRTFVLSQLYNTKNISHVTLLNVSQFMSSL